ncbi:hypothetical protein ACH5RR_000923 [Cinchona calisaya]|uniref:Uncharacterized protein n=1 Tax=Cinchona calisaya TaxID=153742 RepID=A0ABD3B1Y5_9GENT
MEEISHLLPSCNELMDMISDDLAADPINKDSIVPNELQVVQTSWNQYSQGISLQRFSSKVKKLKVDLNIWKKQQFGDIFQRLKATKEDISNQEIVIEQSPSLENQVEFARLKACLLKSFAEEESY